MLECICHIRPPSENAEKTLFTMTVRSKFLKGAPASSESSATTLLSRPALVGVIAATELGNLNAMRVIRSQGDRGQVVALSHQSQSGCGYHTG